MVPILKLRSALLFAGYRVSFSHASKTSIKTDAPSSVLWDILRCWEKMHPIKPERKLEGMPLTKILSKQSEKSYNLSEIHELANPESRKDCLSRFPENPMPFWGPGTRSTSNIETLKNETKKKRNQNKYKSKRKEPDVCNSEEVQNHSKITKIE